jgi:F420-dependent oxidoreductase-like protein
MRWAEYLRIVSDLLNGVDVDFDGTDWTTHSTGRMVRLEQPVSVLLSALSPRMLRVAGEFADGVVLCMASATAVGSRIAPVLWDVASAHGRPAPRIVAGLPVVVHNDVDEARAAVAATSSGYAGMENYRRIILAGGGTAAADVAITGDESSVHRQLTALLDAGATDVWAQRVPVGGTRAERISSIERTWAALQELARGS